MRFSSLHPLVKLGVWLGVVAVLALLIQSAAWLGNWEFNILSNENGGRGILLFLALASLAAIISIDRRPIAEYGLFVGPRWKKLFFGGIGIGGGVYIGYMAIALAGGAFAWNIAAVTPQRGFKALLAAPTGIPLALTQQFLFSGYLLTMLRDRANRLVAIAICAATFAVVGRLDHPEGFWLWQTQSLMLGLFLAAALLGALRVKTGNIVLPAGILAGWLIVSRLTAKLGLLTPIAASPLSTWFAPLGDPRRGPVLWSLLAACIAGVWIWLVRRGESETPLDAPAIDADFKRVFPLSHSNCLTPISVWLRVLAAARFRIGLIYIPRLIAVCVMSSVNTILSLPERLVTPLLIRNRKVRDPVFILGVHRSGTSHLHNLLSLDPQFCSPRTYQVMNPAGFLTTGWVIMPVMGMFMSKRPMDNMRFHIFAPGEEEFAIAGTSVRSPYWGLTFPRQWPHYDRYIRPDDLPPRERNAWKRQFMNLLRKMTLLSRKRPLLKNPYNTARVKVLSELFPQAKFIHIARHPHDVHRSNVHMAKEGHVLNQLQDPVEPDSYAARFLDNYVAMEKAYLSDAAALSADRVAELRFEDLEDDPLAEIRRLYDQLGLTWTEAFEARLRSYLAGVSDYRKNKHRPLLPQVAAKINNAMQPFMQRWRYLPDGATEHDGERARHVA